MRKTSDWRNAARQRIVTVGNQLIRQNPEAELEWIKAEISKTYPFGLRENYPYQVWNLLINISQSPYYGYCEMALFWLESPLDKDLERKTKLDAI